MGIGHQFQVNYRSIRMGTIYDERIDGITDCMFILILLLAKFIKFNDNKEGKVEKWESVMMFWVKWSNIVKLL